MSEVENNPQYSSTVYRINKDSSDTNDSLLINSILKNLKISQEKRDINILLLGETGVGKSMFINAFFNYITYPSLQKAKYKKLHVPIPTQFTITDENYQEQIVKLGKDNNESFEVGDSATQACRSYVYPIPETCLKIRLIDTPGVGDTRGIDQDKINFDNVLSFIGEFTYLNAICILLKPNQSRLTVMFEFCIKQLLSRLEKSASQNIIFVFTNTRSTFYRPGKTLSSLKKLLSTMKGVQIPCEKKNIFCTDSESFRFLATMQNNFRFPSANVSNFHHSWTQSSKECLRMILYIIGDDNNAGLIPHEVKYTISINEARRLIVQLSQPLAEIAQLIEDNIRAVDAHQEVVKNTNADLSELQSKLYVPVVNLKVIKLNQPITVCTSTKCSTLYKVGYTKKWHYKQKCHSPCYLKDVQKEIIGSPALTSCAAMSSNGECVVCSCTYGLHMHVYYETEMFDSKSEDETVKTTITTKEEARQSAHNLTLKLHDQHLKLASEKEIIVKTTAKFACFLKTNAITPFNDAYKTYLEYLIDREKSLNDACNTELITQIERMLGEYVQEKNIILNAMAQTIGDNAPITADDVIKSIQFLYSLEFSGAKIKELFEVQNRARQNENKSQTKEFIFGFNYRPNRPNFKKFSRRGGTKNFGPPVSSNSSSMPGPSFRQTNTADCSPRLNYGESSSGTRNFGPPVSSNSSSMPGPSYRLTNTTVSSPRLNYSESPSDSTSFAKTREGTCSKNRERGPLIRDHLKSQPENIKPELITSFESSKKET